MLRNVRVVALIAVLAFATSSCMFWDAANRWAGAPGQTEPWWCTSGSGPDLDPAGCKSLSAQLDLARGAALDLPTAANAVAAGATAHPYAAGVGARFVLHDPTSSFDARQPDTLLYDGTGSDARVVGVEWNVDAASAPTGFPGSSDVWADQGDGTWRLRAWILRPFENQPDVFASTHPCLAAAGAVYDVSATCFTDTHTNPLEIVVTNDDGYAAPGIDAVVEGLRTLPGVHVDVVAPATNQSGAGDRTTAGGVTGFAAQTQSGYPATAANGTPADSVLYALNTMHLNPDLVVSGINDGQNLGLVVGASGTVGAARTAARNHVQAVAASQEFGTPDDFPSGRAAVVAWVNDFRLGRVGTSETDVDNINIPTCTAGAIRGTVRTTVATAWNGRTYGPSNCTSTSTTVNDDLDALLLGYVGIADVGR